MSLLDPGQVLKKSFRDSSESLQVHITGNDAANSTVEIGYAGNSAIVGADGSLLVRPKLFRSALLPLRLNHAGATITSSYSELIASTSTQIDMLEIFDSSGETLSLAIGVIGSEVPILNIFPGGNGQIAIQIAQGTRLSVRTLTANPTSGELLLNFYGYSV
jgi:hypothetical protein